MVVHERTWFLLFYQKQAPTMQELQPSAEPTAEEHLVDSHPDIEQQNFPLNSDHH